jgi:hypothetical protein
VIRKTKGIDLVLWILRSSFGEKRRFNRRQKWDKEWRSHRDCLIAGRNGHGLEELDIKGVNGKTHICYPQPTYICHNNGKGTQTIENTHTTKNIHHNKEILRRLLSNQKTERLLIRQDLIPARSKFFWDEEETEIFFCPFCDRDVPISMNMSASPPCGCPDSIHIPREKSQQADKGQRLRMAAGLAARIAIMATIESRYIVENCIPTNQSKDEKRVI